MVCVTTHYFVSSFMIRIIGFIKSIIKLAGLIVLRLVSTLPNVPHLPVVVELANLPPGKLRTKLYLRFCANMFFT